MAKLIKYSLTTFFSLLLILVLGALTLTYLYDDRIESVLIDEMNERLQAEIEVNGGIDFTLFRYFPQASLTFRDVKVNGTIGNQPLGDVAELSLLLNLKDLLQGQYRISRILVRDGAINVRRNRAGQVNYHIWKTKTADTTSEDSGSFELTLQHVSLKQLDVSYHDLASGFKIDSDVEKGQLTGHFARERFTLTANLQFLNDSMAIAGATYFPGQAIDLSLTLNVDQTKNKAGIKDGNLTIGGSPFQVEGTVTTYADYTELDLKARGEALSLEDIPRLLPDRYAAHIRAYDGKGKLAVNSFIKGRVDESHLPHIRIQYNLREASLTTKQLDQPIKNLNLKGQFSMYGKTRNPTTLVKLTRCRAEYLGEPFSLQMSLKDLSKPELTLQADGKLNLAVLHPLLAEHEIAHLTGILHVQDLAYDGPLQNINRAVREGQIKSSGTVAMNDVNFDYREQAIKIPQGTFSFSKHRAQIENLSLAVGESRFNIGGRVSHFVSYFKDMADDKAPSRPLQFEGVVKSPYFDVANLLTLFPDTEQTGKAGGNQQADLHKIFHMQGAFSFLVEDLRYKKFRGEDFFGDIVLQPGKITFQKFNMNTMGGQVDINGDLRFPNEQDIAAKANINAENVAIDSMFYANENFGQQTLTHRNLRGRLSSKGQLKMHWQNGTFNMDQLQANASVRIEDGELIDFEPIKDLADHIQIDELGHIKFSTLENTISIEHQTIHIPEMDIVSNAANMSIRGTHTFQNKMDYKVRLNLSKMLAKKFKIIKAPEGGYTKHGKGHLNLFLTMKGQVSDPEIKYDKETVKEKIARDLKDEKEELNRALRGQPSEEYTPAKEKKQWEVDDEYEYIEWDDEEKE